MLIVGSIRVSNTKLDRYVEKWLDTEPNLSGRHYCCRDGCCIIMPGGVSVESPEVGVLSSNGSKLRRRPWSKLLHLSASRRLRPGELHQLADDLVSQLAAGAPALQAERLGLLPRGAGAQDGREIGDRGAPGVPFHRATVVATTVGGATAVPLVLLLPQAAAGAEEAAARGGSGSGCAAPGAERRPGVASGHGVGAVHVAVARQAQPRGVGPAVHHRRHARAGVARRRRLLAAGCVRGGHGFHLRQDKTRGGSGTAQD
jgi:hypothetical protein